MGAQAGVEAGIFVFHLSLAEDGFNHNGQLAVVRHKFGVLLVVTFFTLQLAVTEHETAQLFALFLIIVRRDLIKPKTHMLVIIFTFFSIIQICSGLITELLNKSVFLLEPTFSLLIVVVIVVIVVRRLVLIHFPVVATIVVHTAMLFRSIVPSRHAVFFEFIKTFSGPKLS